MTSPSDGPHPPRPSGDEPTLVSPPVDPHRPVDPPPPGDARTGLPPEEPEPKKPWGWITATAVLAIVALGFAIWAVDLSGNLGDERDKTRAAERAAERAAQDAKQAANQANDATNESNALSDQLDSLTESLKSATQDAREAAESKIDDLRQRLDELLGQAEDQPTSPGDTTTTTP